MLIATFPNQRLAQAFADYMAIKGVELTLHVQQNQVELYLNDESQLSFTQRELQQFVQHPDDPRYWAASWETGKAPEKIAFQMKSPSVLLRTLKHAVGRLTLCVAILTILIYFFELSVGSRYALEILGFPYESHEYAQFWRWLTPIFIHFSLLHITMNLFWWFYLGAMIEKHLSAWKLLEITLLSGLVSNYCESVMSGPNFGGLSGVVYALMGYVWLIGEKAPERGIELPRMMMGIAVIWLVAGFTGYLGPIANGAHLVGLIVGILIALKDIYLISRK